MGAKEVCRLAEMGSVEYGEAWSLQKKLHGQRVRQEIPDVLLLLEHPPTLTIGKSGVLANVLVPPERLTEMGISLFLIERGGDATYHGPGQVVGYPIMDLRQRGKDIYRFITDLEEVMIRTVFDFSLKAGRDPGHRGAWVGKKELGAIGLSVRRWVTMHGFALNVTTDLDHFSLINPCGFTDRQATSMAACLGRDVPTTDVLDRLKHHFTEVFDVDLSSMTEEELGALRSDRVDISL
jgi:lipoate-protein ligase B